MSDLPEGWITVDLGDIADVSSGVGFPKEHQGQTSGDLPFYKVGDISRSVQNNDGYLADAEHNVSYSVARKLRGKPLEPGTTVFAKIGEAIKLNRRAYVQHPCLIDNNVMAVKAHANVDDRLMYFFLRTIDFSDISRATTVPSLRKGDVESLQFPLPPLAEQTRIADKLDVLLARVDACRARLGRVPALLKRFRHAVLAAAVAGRLTEDWRGENGAEEAFQYVTLADIGSNFSYGTSAKSAPSGVMPVLRMGNIQEGRLVWDDLVYTSDPTEIAKYELRPGDVLFNRTNSPELVGKTAVYQGERPAVYAGYLIRVRCSGQLLPDYLSYCLNSPKGRDYCWRVKSDGVSQSNINAKKLAAFEFWLPSRAEQHEIVRRVETLFAYADRLAARTAAARARVEQLTPSLLAQAFRGELGTTTTDAESNG